MDSHQQNVAPTQPQQTYQPVTSNEHIQPVQQQHNEQALPPSYDQAKHAAAGQPPQGANMHAAPAPTTVIPLNMLGDQPQWIDCPFCHKRTTTTVRREGTSMQIVVGAVLCLFCICLACVPCLAGWFEDTQYHCSQCKNMVAVRRHDGPVEIFGPQMPVYSQYNSGQAPMNAQQQQGQVKDAGQVPGQNYQQPQQQQQQQYPQQQYPQQQYPEQHQPQYQQQYQQPQQHQEQYPMHQLEPQVQQQQQQGQQPVAPKN